MCGICGIFTFKNNELTETEIQSVQQMMQQMQRRGPDDAGTWQDATCIMGFRRLAILDLSPEGHQPMTTTDGRFTIVFNGEVYNYPEIRHALELKGIRFRSTGDAEVVLYALAEWGINALERFNGMFALALYDAVEKTLLLARDHAGIKPLYYMLTPRGIVFASQYNQLTRHPWARELPVSPDALGLYLRFGWIPAPYALHEQTHLLEAGSWVKINQAGGLQHGRFFEFPKYRQPTLHGEPAADALDEALDRAVRRHLVSDVPVGLFLSGGIDSPLVAAKARQISGNKMQAFTIGVDDPAMDESDDARAFSSEIGLNHTLRYTNEATALELLDEVALANTEPSADFSIFPTLMVSKLASESVKVVLTGDGGDELFWGYPGRFVPMLEQARYFNLPKPLRFGAIAARKYFGIGHATREVLYPSPGRLFQKKHTLMPENVIDSLFTELPALPTGMHYFEFSDTNLGATAQWTRWNEYHLHLARVLMKADRASMHYSLETRLPLLDKEVIEVALRTDWQTCLNLEQRLGKLPLRAVLSRHVKHQTAKKRGFTVPMHRWLQGPLQGMLQEKVIARKDFFGLPVNHGQLKLMNHQLLNGDQSKAWGLWLLLSLVLWEETHLVREG